MTLFYISGHRKFKTKSRKVMKYEKTLVNFKPFFEFFDIWVPITFRDKELMVWNFEFPSFLLCPTIPFLPFWAIRKTGQIISIWTQFQQMLKIIEIAHILFYGEIKELLQSKDIPYIFLENDEQCCQFSHFLARFSHFSTRLARKICI